MFKCVVVVIVCTVPPRLVLIVIGVSDFTCVMLNSSEKKNDQEKEK